MAGISVFVIFLVLGIILFTALMFVVTHLIARATVPHLARFGDKAWEVHCRKCGWKHNALELGIVRGGAASRGKRILGKCGGCHKWGMLALEHTGTSEEKTI